MAGITVSKGLELVITAKSATGTGLSMAGVRLSRLDAQRLAETLKAYATGQTSKWADCFAGEDVVSGRRSPAKKAAPAPVVYLNPKR